MFPDFAKNLWRKIAAKTLGSILKFCFYFKQEILEQKYVSVHILQVRNAKFIEYGIIQKQGNITECFFVVDGSPLDQLATINWQIF